MCQSCKILYFSGNFGCTFDMFYYPFDTQLCSVLLQSSVSQDLVTFSRDRKFITFLDDRNLPSYFVNGYRIFVSSLDTNQTIYSLLQVTRRWAGTKGGRFSILDL